jgi:hypothetical protein
MSDDSPAAVTPTMMACPKDGAAMGPIGRRAGAYRCPDCRGVFIDVAAMGRRRVEPMPMWAPFVVSVLMSVGMTLLVRRLRRRSGG